jgi:hypothetical protein
LALQKDITNVKKTIYNKAWNNKKNNNNHISTLTEVDARKNRSPSVIVRIFLSKFKWEKEMIIGEIVTSLQSLFSTNLAHFTQEKNLHSFFISKLSH